MSRKQSVLEIEELAEKHSAINPVMQQQWEQQGGVWISGTEGAVSPMDLGGPAPPAPGLLAALPPFLGHAPTSFRQMQANLPGAKATHFVGPVVSGPTGALQVAGAAPLALTLMLDYTMGNFNLAIPFPPGSFVYSWMSVAFTAFNASPGPVVFTMGSQSGLTDIFAAGSFGAALGEIDQNITGSLPLWTAVSPAVPFQGWLNVSGMGGATAGQGLITLFYFRLPLPWN